jgi:hypothetical protein
MDYATRIICDSAPGNIVSLPSSDGTLALTTDNVASATKATLKLPRMEVGMI